MHAAPSIWFGKISTKVFRDSNKRQLMTTQTNVATKARHGADKRKQRNSSIELLRIIAMLMILSHHFVVHNGSPLSQFP